MRPAGKVLFVQATDAAAYPPLLHAAQIFIAAGWRVTFLSAPKVGRGLEYPKGSGFEIVHAPARPSHVWPAHAYAGYCRQAIALARSRRPDLVYASDPIGALPGLLAARAAGARLIYHEHDSPNAAAKLSPVIRWARRSAAKRALRVVFPNLERAQRCAPDLGCEADRLAVVWNAPGKGEVPDLQKWRSDRFVLYYHGGISPDRVPRAAVEAISGFNGRALLRLVGRETPGAAGYVGQLIDRFGSADRGGTVDHVGIVPSRAEMLRVASDADAGLMLVPRNSADINFACMTGASNKAFEYMAAGLPLLVSALPDWQTMFVEPGHALAVDPGDPGSIVDAIGTLFDNPAMRAEMGRRNRDRILDDWNYETCFAPVLAAIEGTLV